MLKYIDKTRDRKQNSIHTHPLFNLKIPLPPIFRLYSTNLAHFFRVTLSSSYALLTIFRLSLLTLVVLLLYYYWGISHYFVRQTQYNLI